MSDQNDIIAQDDWSSWAEKNGIYKTQGLEIYEMLPDSSKVILAVQFAIKDLTFEEKIFQIRLLSEVAILIDSGDEYRDLSIKFNDQFHNLTFIYKDSNLQIIKDKKVILYDELKIKIEALEENYIPHMQAFATSISNDPDEILKNVRLAFMLDEVSSGLSK